MARSQQAILGRRRLTVLGETRRRYVTVTVTLPQHIASHSWRCELRISGAGLSVCQRIDGSDVLQAIQLALMVGARELDRSGLRLSWGKPDERWTRTMADWDGFERSLPRFIGPDGADRNERVRAFLEREQRDYARATLERVRAEYVRMGTAMPSHILAALERAAGIESARDNDIPPGTQP
jgi:hypothetical protein